MSPGIGLMKRRLEKEADAVALAVSGVVKKYVGVQPSDLEILETKYDEDGGDWYVALGWADTKNDKTMTVVVRMDSVLGTVTQIDEISRQL